MVGTDAAEVERDLGAGKLGCPACAGVLGPWGFARWRIVRGADGEERRQPRRARCRSCLVSHVVLARDCLRRRRVAVAVIGAALRAKAGGRGHRLIAAALDVPDSTVRGWLRRFAARAEQIRGHFTVWAHALDPTLAPVDPAGSPLGDALEAIAVAARAVSLRLGVRPPWQTASALTAGALLSNTTSPWLVP
jgi:hypothetical protein